MKKIILILALSMIASSASAQMYRAPNAARYRLQDPNNAYPGYAYPVTPNEPGTAEVGRPYYYAPYYGAPAYPYTYPGVVQDGDSVYVPGN